MPPELTQLARQIGHSHLAVTDVNCLAGAPAFHKRAVEAGLRPLIGAELTDGDGGSLLALITEEAGYSNLCRLITRRQAADLDHEFVPHPIAAKRSLALLDNHAPKQTTLGGGTKATFGLKTTGLEEAGCPRLLADVAALQEGLLFVTDVPADARRLADKIDPGRLWLGIDPATQTYRQLQGLQRASGGVSLPLAATGKAMLARAATPIQARLLSAIRLGKTFDTVPPDEVPHPGAVLRRGERIGRPARGLPSPS